MPTSISCEGNVRDCLRDAHMRDYVNVINELADELYQTTGQGEDAPDINKLGGPNLVGIDGRSAYRLGADAKQIADDLSADLTKEERDAFRYLAGAANALGRADAAASPFNAPWGIDYYTRLVQENLIGARVSAGAVQDFLEGRDD